MLRHIVMWKFADDSEPAFNRENAIKIKAALEEFEFLVHGAVRVDVHIEPLRTSNADILLDAVFQSREAFEAYREHPNFRGAVELIKECTGDRLCVDYEFE